MAESDEPEHPSDVWRYEQSHGFKVPAGVEPCDLEPPCPHCRSLQGYNDTRYGTLFCARCGRNIRRTNT